MSAQSLNRQRLIRQIGRRTRLPNQSVQAVVEALIDILSDHLADGGRVELANFLTLEVQERSRLVKSAPSGDNSPTADAGIETFFVLKCRPGQAFRNRLRQRASPAHSRPTGR